uniref:Uncharacterized protein n=1 Tax=Brassica oleracea TaxID=3712 RepID=A0A3P6BK70_BRAOL|nr:unnamed protein product [Brassica oleracea]
MEMEMDEIKAHLLENGIDMDAEDFLKNLSEEEELALADEEIKGQDNGVNSPEEEELAPAEEEKGPAAEYIAKKQGTRKRLFKPTINTAGSTKTRIASALVSPRKRAAAKTGSHQGDNSKQPESKGTSNPKHGHQKS